MRETKTQENLRTGTGAISVPSTIRSNITEILSLIENLEKETLTIEETLTPILSETPKPENKKQQQNAECIIQNELTIIQEKIITITKTLESIRRRCML